MKKSRSDIGRRYLILGSTTRFVTTGDASMLRKQDKVEAALSVLCHCLVFDTYKMLLPSESLPPRNTVKPVNSSFLRCRCMKPLKGERDTLRQFAVGDISDSVPGCVYKRSQNACSRSLKLAVSSQNTPCPTSGTN
jgi:hypothetical protein